MLTSFSPLFLVPLFLTPQVDNLGSRSFRVREKSHRILSASGPLAWYPLLRGEKSKDPEIRTRCNCLLMGYRKRYAWDLAGRYLSKYKKVPWLYLDPDPDATNSDPYSCSREITHYVVRTQDELRSYCNTLPEWFDKDRNMSDFREWRAATRLWLSDRIAQGWGDIEIQSALMTMRIEETRWMYSHSYLPLPPPPMTPATD